MGDLSSEAIQLPNTQVKTMEDFFVWTFSPQPQIDERATFSDVVRLGIFAWRYQISALSNQVTDIIRSNLANGHWHLQASTVDEVYEAVPTESALREVTRAALGGLPVRSSVEGDARVREEWKATFLKHAQLGWDYLEAGRSEWVVGDYLSGACRFHDHQGVSHPEESSMLGNQCMYAREECFPRWEEESMKGGKDEVGPKGWIPMLQERYYYGEKERGDTAEERKERDLSHEANAEEAEKPVAAEAMLTMDDTVAKEAKMTMEPVINSKATDAVVDGEKTEAAVATEAPGPEANIVSTDAAVNGMPTEAVEEVADNLSTNAVVDGVTTEAVEAFADDVSTDAAFNGVTAEAPANDRTTEAPVNGMETQAAKPEINGLTTETAVDGITPEAPVNSVATEAPVNGTMKEATVKEAPVNGITPEAPINGTEKEAPVNSMATEASVNRMATEAPTNGLAKEAPSNGLSKEAAKPVVNGLAKEAPTNDLSNEAVKPVVNGLAKGAPINGMAKEALANGLTKEETKLAILTMTTEAPVNGMTPEPAKVVVDGVPTKALGTAQAGGDEAESPVEPLGNLAEKVDEAALEKVPMEAENGKKSKKKKKKNANKAPIVASDVV